MTTKKLYAGDYGFNLNFAIKDGDGAAVDLTDATAVTFKLIRKGGSVVKVSGACTKNEPNTLGTCYYTLQATDLDEVGEFEYQIQITTTSSVTTCEPQETINVLRKL